MRLSHLPDGTPADLIAFMDRYSSLFGDMPTRTHWIEHDIDIGDAERIRQRFCRVSSIKRKDITTVVHYMLASDIA